MNNEMNNENTSGINTVLIVMVLIALVGLGVWWITSMNNTDTSENTPTDSQSDTNFEINLPDSDEATTTN